MTFRKCRWLLSGDRAASIKGVGGGTIRGQWARPWNASICSAMQQKNFAAAARIAQQVDDQ
jgi:hypothetical protein